jgi:hypothetical protein
MTWYYLEKPGERPKVVGASPPGLEDERPEAERVLDGYPGYAVTRTLDGLLGDFEYIDRTTGAVVEDLPAAERKALALLDQRQDAVEGAEARSPTRIRSIMFTWYEVQDLKRVAPAAVGAMTAAERAARWPFLMALVAESGASLTQVATTAETALAPKVAKLARYEARAEMGRRAVQTASTAATKEAAAGAVTWNGVQQGAKAVNK